MFIKDKPSQPWHRLNNKGDEIPLALCGHRPIRKQWFYLKETIPTGERMCQSCTAVAVTVAASKGMLVARV